MYTFEHTYTDFKGNERTRELNFHMSKADAYKLELSHSGGLTAYLNKILSDQNWPEMCKYFEKFILMTYGEISIDGDRFMQSEEISNAFKETVAYDELFTKLITDAEYATNFFNAIIPQEGEGTPNNVVKPSF